MKKMLIICEFVPTWGGVFFCYPYHSPHSPKTSWNSPTWPKLGPGWSPSGHYMVTGLPWLRLLFPLQRMVSCARLLLLSLFNTSCKLIRSHQWTLKALENDSTLSMTLKVPILPDWAGRRTKPAEKVRRWFWVRCDEWIHPPILNCQNCNQCLKGHKSLGLSVSL